MNRFFESFKKAETVPDYIIDKYKDKVPKQMLVFWKEYGFGSCLDGYLKSVNPEDFEEILLEGSKRYQDGIVLFATSMGDLLIWSEDYVRMLNFRYGVVDTILFKFDFFFQNVSDEYFREKYMKYEPYSQAVKLYGVPEYDECFGYVPLLGIGGSEKVENLNRVKLIEHILIIINLVGPIT